MRTGTAILLAVGATVAVGGIAASKYYKAADRLQFNLVSFLPVGDSWQVTLSVANPNSFGYPVPRMFFNVIDTAGNYYGVIYSSEPQWIKAGTTTLLRAYLLPSFAAIIATLVQALRPGEQLRLVLQGSIGIGGINIPVQFQLSQNLLNG